MDDWAPGDLALCVMARHPNYPHPSSRLTLGAIYTVLIVGEPIENFEGKNFHGERALAFREVETRHPGCGFPETLFRKIRAHTADAEDLETIRLLIGEAVEAPALSRPVHGGYPEPAGA